MSQNQKIRSKLMIRAVARAAAAGSVITCNPTKKFAAIAGFAGFVLRLFRYREALPYGVGASRLRARKPMRRDRRLQPRGFAPARHHGRLVPRRSRAARAGRSREGGAVEKTGPVQVVARVDPRWRDWRGARVDDGR